MSGTENPGAPASATGVRNTERTSKSLYCIRSTSAREREAFLRSTLSLDATVSVAPGDHQTLVELLSSRAAA
jgi:hypothetical protein